MPNKNEQNIIERPPVVCIMGHIDHGKSTLLDYIRKTNIVDKEAGGITQKLSAYEVAHKTKDGATKKITFLDTPGHEAFSAIRSRGAHVADVAVLVVSAEDGVKKQTIEALNTIKRNDIAYVVAINKIDKPGADIERTKINLAENEIYVEGYGGNISFVPISAKTGQGVEDLLDIILLTAELMELKADTNKPATGVVIETNMDPKQGLSAQIIIEDGSIKKGQFVVAGNAIAPVRIMENFLGKKIDEATVSAPIKIVGFDKLPKVGAEAIVFDSRKEAEAFLLDFKEEERPRFEVGQETVVDPTVGLVEAVIKVDNAGSLEAIEHELAKVQTDRIKIKIISAGIGDITENDVNMASGKAGAMIVGFNVKVDSKARGAIENKKIDVKLFDIIYKLTEWLALIASERTPKVRSEEETGRAKVLKYFSNTKDRHVIGCRLEDGTIEVNDELKIMRNEVEVGRGRVRGLQQQKQEVKEVKGMVEFGMSFQAGTKPEPGDKVHAFKVIEK